MKSARVLAIICLLLLSFLPPVSAEQRSRRAPAKRRPAATRSTRRSSGAAVARERVAEQIKLLTRFLYLFGRISNEIEASEEGARRAGEPQSLPLSNRNRLALIENLRNVRAGLEQLETDFRTTPELEPYYTRVAGVAARAAEAESQAAANQLDGAGRSLIMVVNQLADALREIV